MPKVKGQLKDRVAEKDARKLLKLKTLLTQGEETTDGTTSWKVVCATAFNGDGLGTGSTAPASNALLVSSSSSVFVKQLYLFGQSQESNRIIVVYWHNMPIPPSSDGVNPDLSGTLPSIDEVLVAGSVEITRGYLNKRVKCTVLFDKCYSTTEGTVKEIIDVNKRVTFVQQPTAAQYGGHYDSTTNVGLVSKGLICVYYYGSGQLYTQVKYIQ